MAVFYMDAAHVRIGDLHIDIARWRVLEPDCAPLPAGAVARHYEQGVRHFLRYEQGSMDWQSGEALPWPPGDAYIARAERGEYTTLLSADAENLRVASERAGAKQAAAETLRADARAGRAPKAATLLAYLAPDLLPAPPAPMAAPVVSQAQAGELVATWTPPDDGGAPVSGYKLRHRRAGNARWAAAVTADADDRAHTFTSLAAGEWEVAVAAVNVAGEGELSPVAEITLS